MTEKRRTQRQLRHYVKVLQWLESHARRSGCNAQDWPAALFDDITARGTAVDAYPLPPRESGPLIALLGAQFFCEAGIDRDREDALFVSRVESASRRLPAKAPARFEGHFVLVQQLPVPAERLNSVRPLCPASAGM